MAKPTAEDKDKELTDFIAEMTTALRIDRNDLDAEIEKQADVYYRVAEKSAYAASERDQRKTRSDQVFAEVSERIRNGASRRDDRLTENKLKEQALLDEDYIRSQRSYSRAKRIYDSLSALERAFDMRGKMLRELAQLYIAGYYQTSSVRASGSRMKEASADRAREAMYNKRKGGNG